MFTSKAKIVYSFIVYYLRTRACKQISTTVIINFKSYKLTLRIKSKVDCHYRITVK